MFKITLVIISRRLGTAGMAIPQKKVIDPKKLLREKTKMPKQVDRFRMRPSMGPIDGALITERSDEEIAAGGKWIRKWHGI